MASYAQAAAHNVPTTPTRSTKIVSVHMPSDDTKTSVQEWLKATEVNGPRSGQSRKRPSKPTSDNFEPTEARRSSEPVITVVRNGKVYKSRKTPEGELNARERRKLRRAQEREEKERLGSEAGRSVDVDQNDQAECSEVGTSELGRRDSEAITLVRAAWNAEQSAVQNQWASYDPFSTKAATVLYSSSSSSASDGDHPLPPNTILAPIPLPAHAAVSRKRAGYPVAPPPTPSPSIESNGADQNVVSLITPPRSPPHSRRSSLNVDAPTFMPTRMCPLTPRSPSNSGRPRPASITIPSSNYDLAPEVAERSPASAVSADFFTHSRKHSIALAAWEVAQKRLSEKYDTPEYCSTDAWSFQGRSPINPEVEMVHSPQVHATISPISPFGIGLEQATYHDIQGYGFPSPFSSPRWPTFAGSVNGELPSPLISPGVYTNSSRRGSHRHSLSSSSLGHSDRSPIHQFSFDRRVSVGSAGSLCSVHAELGEDPEIDHLADIQELTLAPDEKVFPPPSSPRPTTPAYNLSSSLDEKVIRPSHDRKKSRLSMMLSNDGEWVE